MWKLIRLAAFAKIVQVILRKKADHEKQASNVRPGPV
jgi:hypothetical protein